MAHRHLQRVIRHGVVALDATCGNGHDTVFLANAVGREGRVIALDLQPEALRNTRQRLESNGLNERVTLVQGRHQDLRAILKPYAQQALAAAVFNLGFLPGGDKGIVTEVSETLQALDTCWSHLAPGGACCVMAYTGHPGGTSETDAVRDWAGSRRNAGASVSWYRPGNRTNPPELFFVQRPA